MSVCNRTTRFKYSGTLQNKKILLVPKVLQDLNLAHQQGQVFLSTKSIYKQPGWPDYFYWPWLNVSCLDCLRHRWSLQVASPFPHSAWIQSPPPPPFRARKLIECHSGLSLNYWTSHLFLWYSHVLAPISIVVLPANFVVSPSPFPRGYPQSFPFLPLLSLPQRSIPLLPCLLFPQDLWKFYLKPQVSF